jgi:hypothetical protein
MSLAAGPAVPWRGTATSLEGSAGPAASDMYAAAGKLVAMTVLGLCQPVLAVDVQVYTTTVRLPCAFVNGVCYKTMFLLSAARVVRAHGVAGTVPGRRRKVSLVAALLLKP